MSVVVGATVSVGGGSSFFFSFGGAVVFVVSVVSVCVSVGGGGALVVVSVVSVVGVRGRCGAMVSVVVGADGVALVIGGCVDVGTQRCAADCPVVVGNVPATVFGVPCVPSGAGLSSRVKFVVVSTPVFVIGGVVSPGAWIVDVTPLACPSGTT